MSEGRALSAPELRRFLERDEESRSRRGSTSSCSNWSARGRSSGCRAVQLERYIQRMVSKQEGQQSDQERPTGAAGGHQVGEQQGKAQRQKRQSPAKRRGPWRPKLKAEWRKPIPILTFFLVLLTAVYVVVTARLLGETAEAVDLTRESLQLTRRSVEATEAALKLAEENKGLTELGLADSREQARASLEESKRQAEESLTLARQSLELGREELAISARPWVVVKSVEHQGLFDVLIGARYLVTFFNGGATPAIDFRGQLDVFSSGYPEAPKILAGAEPLLLYPSYTTGTIAPGGTYTVMEIRPPEWVEPGTAPPIVTLYAVGRYTYKDFANREYSVGFCLSCFDCYSIGDWFPCDDKTNFRYEPHPQQ